MKRHGITRQTFYRWRRKYGGLTEDEAQRLKRLERENARLKALIAERDLEIEVLRSINAKKWWAPRGGGPRPGMQWGGGLRRRRPRRKQRTGARVNPLAAGPNAVWTYDFVHDWAARGGQFKCLSVVDEYTKEYLALVAARSLPAAEVLRVPSQLVARYGAPRYLRSDNGPEFIARRLRRWLAQSGIATAYIDPGKPWQNGVGESRPCTSHPKNFRE